METTFDPAKDAPDAARHSVLLALAAELEGESAVVWTGARLGHGKTCIAAGGYIGGVCTAAFVRRGI